jgi:hypothetical protein
MTPQSITARLRALMAEASPAPWEQGRSGSANVVCFDGDDVRAVAAAYGYNAALIAESRNVLGELLAVVEAAAEREPHRIEDPEDNPNTECLFCGEYGKFDGREYVTPHAPDCAWVLARKLTGGGV